MIPNEKETIETLEEAVDKAKLIADRHQANYEQVVVYEAVQSTKYIVPDIEVRLL